MKIKKLLNNEIAYGALCASLTLGTLLGAVGYYNYDNQKQICETDENINRNNILSVDEEGNYTCYFDVGEHIIEVSRNDAFYYKAEEIEGYTIKSVIVNGYRDNNKITYVNTVPVIVIGREQNGKLEFNGFGTIVDTEKTKTR